MLMTDKLSTTHFVTNIVTNTFRHQHRQILNYYFQSIFAETANPNHFRFGTQREIQYDSRSSSCSSKILEEKFEKNGKEKPFKEERMLSSTVIKALSSSICKARDQSKHLQHYCTLYCLLLLYHPKNYPGNVSIFTQRLYSLTHGTFNPF